MANKLLLVLSTLNSGSKEENYTTPVSGLEMKGCMQTNEAPSKYIIHTLSEKGEILDEILYLATPEVGDKVGALPQTSSERYELP
jgi:hypothetical protein